MSTENTAAAEAEFHRRHGEQSLRKRLWVTVYLESLNLANSLPPLERADAALKAFDERFPIPEVMVCCDKCGHFTSAGTGVHAHYPVGQE